MKPFRYATLAAIAVAAATMFQAPRALAASSVSTAVGSCQASLATYEAGLRKRPLAIQNGGTTSVFLTCSSQSGYNAIAVDAAIVIAKNLNAAAVEVSCTLVDGPLPGLASYYTKTLTFPPGQFGVFGWAASEYGLTTFSGSENFSCKVPPGVEINVVGFNYYFDSASS